MSGMKLFGKDLEHEVAVVAEIGVNHEGDVAVAEALVRAAAQAGADAVKLQTYTPERFASASDPARLARVARFRLDEAAHRHLAEVARGCGISLFSTAVTEDVVGFLADLGPAVKVASGDVDFEILVRAAARSGKPVILSTGNAALEEIDRAVDWCASEIGRDRLPERLALLHCVSAYPAPIEQANVRTVPFLKARYGLTTGYSNHVLESEAVLAAVALGAQIVEVHFTDRKSGREFRDHALSFEPAELAALVRSVDLVRTSLGEDGKRIQPAEAPLRQAIRKGVVAARDLAAGTVLQDADLMYARPATEFAAAERPHLVGRRLLRDLKRGELVRRSAVAP
jgi:N-acetylneuraminate synthase/N,N'-diacetyllegionaminate synthase